MSEVENKRQPRALIGKDLYLLTSIIGKIGIRNIMAVANTLEVKEVMQDSESMSEDDLKDKIGTLIFYGIIDVILEKMEKCEDVISRLLSRLYDMPEAEVKKLDANEYLDMLIDVVKDEKFVDFFKRAYGSVKQVM